MSRGIVLPGWDCLGCGAFNGSAREVLESCRCCGRQRPPDAMKKLRGGIEEPMHDAQQAPEKLDQATINAFNRMSSEKQKAMVDLINAESAYEEATRRRDAAHTDACRADKNFDDADEKLEVARRAYAKAFGLPEQP